MPARTNVNHATLATGVYPEMHDITGNVFWARTADPPRKLGAAADFLTETLFTVAAAHDPPLRTALAVGKPKLELMFATTAAGHAVPDDVWSPKDAPSSGRDAATGYATDGATLAGARRLLENGRIRPRKPRRRRSGEPRCRPAFRRSAGDAARDRRRRRADAAQLPGLPDVGRLDHGPVPTGSQGASCADSAKRQLLPQSRRRNDLVMSVSRDSHVDVG